MSLEPKPKHLRRYRDVALLLLRFGHMRDAASKGLGAFQDDNARRRRGRPPDGKAFAQELERLGPTFIELGQLLASRADLLPPSYMEALSRLTIASNRCLSSTFARRWVSS